ncbi:LisH motif-containing protein [Phaffia rhodozyma]|uniref:LisH motif-containing protein n=1 Tax=Phaffia rhodozyma TaxID=264483 RepID=A0A0F7SHB8_PHARH|nr:LisH motif-containing protein [Phaffia rhodozyma]
MKVSNVKHEPDPSHVKRIVLEYLSHHTYLATARALSQPRSSTSKGKSSQTSQLGHSSDQDVHPADTTSVSDPNGESVQYMVDPASEVAAQALIGEVNPDPDGDEAMMAAEEDSSVASSQPIGKPSDPGHEVRPDDLEEDQMKSGGFSETEFKQIGYRKDIKIAILKGETSLALDLINKHFPLFFGSTSQINQPTPSLGPTHSQPDTTPSTPSRKKSKPSAPSPSATIVSNPTSTFKPVLASSIHPPHVYLNLQIQIFIELIRTIPLPYPPNSKTPVTPVDSPNPSPTSSAQSNSSALSTSLNLALNKARDLYNHVESLQEERDRDWYRKELHGVTSLFAYVPPETAPTKKYLERERREALADQINSAILIHTGQAAPSVLESLVRQTSVVWDQLSEQNVDPVPPWTKEDGAEWETLASYFKEHRTFALSEFLDV